ncbi:MAG: GNAT family N-acetyltransferase, partial [Dehalococcoidia bacterium]|nr:GNAT family N-acetyltransferase [Dehalococcoidia bacterium]
MKAEKARIDDIPQIQKLVNYFAQKGEMLPRALSELYENIRDFSVVRDGEQMVACAALHIFWSDLAEIRAVAVV